MDGNESVLNELCSINVRKYFDRYRINVPDKKRLQWFIERKFFKYLKLLEIETTNLHSFARTV